MSNANPYASSAKSSASKPRREISFLKFILTCFAGGLVGLVGLVGAFLAFASGFHGNFPHAWLYICGPTTWVIELFATSDKAYVISLVAGSVFQWIFYAIVLVVPIGKARLKAVALIVFHFVSAACYQAIVEIG